MKAPPMASEKNWYLTLTAIDAKTRGIALVALVVDAVTLATIPLLPAGERIYGYIGFVIVLIVTVICMVVVAKSTSQDHTQPNLRVRVKELTKKLIEARFLPQLIIAIPRGGLAVAGLLAKELGEEQIVPVISLSPSRGSGFDNSFNTVRFGRRDFDSSTADPIRILIIDDISRSGRTLDDARAYVERFIDQGDFVIRTAAISFYRSHNRATPPSFFVDRPTEAIRDASGDVEVMYE
jgi:hypoxanthine phosphoribosyltransferase